MMINYRFLSHRFKSILCVIIVLCVVVSSVFVFPTITQATKEEKIEMLYIEGAAGGRLSAEYTLEKNATYTIYYKYRIESGSFGLSDSRTCIFSDVWSGYTHHSTHVSSGKNVFIKGDGEEGFNDIELTFTNDLETTNNSKHDIGLAFWGDTKLYIADYKMYKVEGDEKVLLDSGFGKWLNKKGTVSVKEEDYSETLFAEQMLKLSGNSAAKFGFKAALEDGVKYKVYYKYKVEEGVFGISDSRTIVFADRATDGTNRIMHSTHLHKSPSAAYPKLQVPFEKGMGEDEVSDISLTFTAYNDYANDYDMHFLEFQFWRGVNSIYIADFKLYKIDGENEILIESGFDSMKTFEGSPNVIKNQYDESLFKEQMVKISGGSGSKFGIKVGLARGKQYKIYFKYKVVEGSFGTSSSRSIVFSDVNATNQGQTFHSTHILELGSLNYPELQKPFEKDVGSDEWSDIALTMTAATQYVDSYDNHLLLFQFWSGSNTIYVADFRIYSIDDGKEVLIETSTNGMKTFAGSPSSEYSDYDEELFKEQMLKLSGSSDSRFALTLDLKKDVEYKAYFKYKVEEGYFGTGENRTIVFSVRNPIGMYYQYASHHAPGENCPFVRGGGETGWNDIELSFTGKQLNQPYNNHMLSFDFWNAENTIYLADFRLYRIDGDSERLVESGFSCFKVNTGEVSVEYMDYNPDLFNSNEDYMLQIYDLNYYGTKANRYLGKDVSLVGGKEYKIMLKSQFTEGSIQHDSVNLIVADVDSNGEIKNVYYTSDDTDNSALHFKKSSEKSVAIDEYIFTAPDSGNYYLAFEIKDRVIAFVSEIVVTENDNDSSTTVLYEDFSTISLEGWHSLSKTAADSDSFLFDNYKAEIVNKQSSDELRLFSRNNLPRQMLYFELGEGMRRWLSASFRGSPGETFKARISVGGALDPFSGVVAIGSSYNIAISPADMTSYTSEAGYYTAEYEFTIPEHIADYDYDVLVGDGINFGLVVPANSSGYILDFSVWRAEDKSQTNIVKNNDFKSGLSNWGFYWVDGLRGFRKDMFAPFEVSTDDGSLKVMDYDADIYMLHGDDTYFNDGEWWDPDDYVEETQETSCDLNGLLVDGNGKKLSGIKLSLQSNSNKYVTTTNSGGKFNFNSIPAGFYELYIIKSNGDEVSTGYFAVLSDGDTVSVEVEYKTEYITINSDATDIITGDITGVVYTPQRKTIPDMTLYLRGIDTTVTTNSDGYFEFVGLAPGDYELYTIDENNKEYVFRQITVKENVKLSVKLKYDNLPEESASENGEGNNYLTWILVSVGSLFVIGTLVLIIFIKKRRKSN